MQTLSGSRPVALVCAAQVPVHSSLGHAGGFIGPLVIRFILDLGGGVSRFSWSLAFHFIAGQTVLALIIFRTICAQELAGDRPAH